MEAHLHRFSGIGEDWRERGSTEFGGPPSQVVRNRRGDQSEGFAVVGVGMASAGHGDEEVTMSPKEAGKIEKKAKAREELVTITSGAREIVDGATANARAVTTILLHPFNKQVREDAVAKAREFKALSAQHQATVRAIGAQQAAQQRMMLAHTTGQSPETLNGQEHNDGPTDNNHPPPPIAAASLTGA